MATQAAKPAIPAIPATMPAAYIEHTGAAEENVAGRLPVPQPRPRRVLVRVVACCSMRTLSWNPHVTSISAAYTAR